MHHESLTFPVTQSFPSAIWLVVLFFSAPLCPVPKLCLIICPLKTNSSYLLFFFFEHPDWVTNDGKSFGQWRSTTTTEKEVSQTEIMRELPVALPGSAVEAGLLITTLRESIDFYLRLREWEDWIHSAEGGFNFNSKGTVFGNRVRLEWVSEWVSKPLGVLKSS